MPEETNFPNPWPLDPRIRRIDDGGTYYIAGELLVATRDVSVALEGLGRLGIRAIRPDAEDPLSEYVVRLTVPDVNGEEPNLPALVDRLRSLDGSPRVGLNHAFAANPVPSQAISGPITGQPKLHGGPGTDPTPVPTPPLPEPPTPSRMVRVAVIDSGLAPSAQILPVFYQHGGLHEPDPVYENTAVRQIGLMGGHGTAVAGVIARYARKTYITSIQVTSVAGLTDEATFALGVLRARDSGAEIINMSLGGTYQGSQPPLALELVFDDLPPGTVLVAAAGNCSGATPNFYPANRPGVISVAAIDTTGAADAPAAFSNTGNWITACAPGVRIHLPYVHGTWNYGSSGPLSFLGNMAWSGTSFAAPYVTAQIAANTTVKETCADAAARLLGSLQTPFPGYGVYLPAQPGFVFP